MPRTRLATALIVGFLAFTGLSLAAAWFNIQAVRWGYRNRGLSARWEDLRKSEEVLDRRLHDALSLDRLERAAHDQFRLKIPSPDQIVLVPERREKPG